MSVLSAILECSAEVKGSQILRVSVWVCVCGWVFVVGVYVCVCVFMCVRVVVYVDLSVCLFDFRVGGCVRMYVFCTWVVEVFLSS